MSTAWSDREVELAVQDYFAMLFAELKGEKYVKSQHNKLLAERLNGRSRGSVEFKHENISAVLLELELPYIDGYKPRKNVQGLLRNIVEHYAWAYRDVLKQADIQATPVEPQRLDAIDWSGVLVEPPELKPAKQARSPAPPHFRREFNFAGQEANNRRLGELGEQFVLKYETIRLENTGKHDLARHVEWVAENDAGAGFDILSFDDRDKERFIEVKTTNYGRSFPFMISPNEVRVSEREAHRYCLYRLFTYRANPRLFMLHGNIKTHCNLEVENYRANFGSAA